MSNEHDEPDTEAIDAENDADPTADHAADDDVATGFATLGLRDELLAALDDLGYEEPTPIQR